MPKRSMAFAAAKHCRVWHEVKLLCIVTAYSNSAYLAYFSPTSTVHCAVPMLCPDATALLLEPFSTFEYCLLALVEYLSALVVATLMPCHVE